MSRLDAQNEADTGFPDRPFDKAREASGYLRSVIAIADMIEIRFAI